MPQIPSKPPSPPPPPRPHCPPAPATTCSATPKPPPLLPRGVCVCVSCGGVTRVGTPRWASGLWMTPPPPPPREEVRGGVCCNVKPQGLVPWTLRGHGGGDSSTVPQPTFPPVVGRTVAGATHAAGGGAAGGCGLAAVPPLVPAWVVLHRLSSSGQPPQWVEPEPGAG